MGRFLESVLELGLLGLRCAHCGGAPPAPRRLPLCEECFAALIPAPPVCLCCGELHCEDTGARETRTELPHRVWHFGAACLLVGAGHGILRTWKKRRGPAWTPLLTPFVAALARRIEAASVNWDGVCFVPQSVQRSLRLGGNPAEGVARLLARELGVPVVAALTRVASAPQAQRSAWERRYSAEPESRFRATTLVRGQTLLLVDDFWTTGATSRQCAQALLQGGAVRVGTAALGLRPKVRN